MITSHVYTFDHVGNRMRIDEDGGYYTTFWQDAVYEVTNQTRWRPDGSIVYSIAYSYDGVGNRTQKWGTGGTVDYTYDGNNKLLTETLAGSTTTYGYDANGNTTSKYVPGSGTTTYSYDRENRMTGITYPGGGTAAFQYNGDGLRVRATESGWAQDYFVYDGVRPWGRLGANNVFHAIYVGEGGSYYSPILSMGWNATNYTYLRDGGESVRKVLNTSQQVTDSYEYDAFGIIMSQSGTSTNPYRYVGALGYYRDWTTSLLHVGARYYSPGVGRFWTQDPAGSPANLYAYGRANPVNVVDADGENPLLVCAVAAAAIAALAGCARRGRPRPKPQVPPSPPPSPDPCSKLVADCTACSAQLYDKCVKKGAKKGGGAAIGCHETQMTCEAAFCEVAWEIGDPHGWEKWHPGLKRCYELKGKLPKQPVPPIP